MRHAHFLTIIPLWLAGCSTSGVDSPSLQPRAGEQVDPRIPVEGPTNDRPVNPAIVTRLDALVAQARSGEAAFRAALSNAERAAAEAGPRQSESWIAAQELLSAAIQARGSTAAALGEIDSLGATLLAEQGGLSPSDKQAIDEAARVVGAIDEAQAAGVAAIKARLES